MHVESRISDFLEAVAAKKPTPGGGSVSALVGALGASLGVMTARYSDDSEAERDLEAVKAALLPLVDQDAEAYGLVASAMSLPKDSDETKRRRKAALQNAFGEAAEVPLQAMRHGVQGLEALARLAPRCNKHLTSDLFGSALFLASAVEGCGENVAVNAASLADKEQRSRLEDERGRLVAQAQRLRSDVVRSIEAAAAGK